MPSPFPGEYLVWAENGLSGKVVEHVLEHMVHATDELADHATTDPFAELDTAARRGRRRAAATSCSCPGSPARSRPTPTATMRGGFLEPVPRHRAPPPRPRRDRGRGPQPRVAPPVGRGVLRSPRATRSASAAARPVARSGCRRWPTSSTGPCSPLRDPHQTIARATALYALVPGGVLTDADLAGIVDTPARRAAAPSTAPPTNGCRRSSSPRSKPCGRSRAALERVTAGPPPKELSWERIPVRRPLPRAPRHAVRRTRRNAIIAELADIATNEDKTWETGKCSGTMYCGDHDHYDFMNEVFGCTAT